MEALIFACFALFLHYDRKLVLFILCVTVFFLLCNLLPILFPYFIFQNVITITLLQLCFIYAITKIDHNFELSILFFTYSLLTIVTTLGYFYLPFIKGISWLLIYESRMSLELIVWINFVIFKAKCRDTNKQNILFWSWIFIGYGEYLWHCLI